jgi:hypothetical protein
MPLHTLSIIVPLHNQSIFTKKFIVSVLAQETSFYEYVVVVFIDNNSTDDTPTFLKNVPDTNNIEFNCITNDENLGFAKAVNQGIKFSLENYPECDILVTNNDIEFLSGCWDALATTAYKDPTRGIVGGKLLFSDGRIQHGGAWLNVLGWGQHKGGGTPSDTKGICDKEEEQEYVTGALFFIKNELILKLKGFDEQFSPAFFEETDFVYSARQLGYKTIYTPDARAIHYENTTGKALHKDPMTLKITLSDANQVKFYQKWPGPLTFPEDKDREHKILLQGKIYGDWSFTNTLKKLALGLDKAGVDVSIAPDEYHNVLDMPDWKIKKMILKPNDYWNRVVLRHSEGDHMYVAGPGKKRIGYVALENSILNSLWKDQLNHLDLVLCVSSFVQNILKEGGVTTPTEILTNCVDISSFHPDIEPYPLGYDLAGFCFYSIFSFGERKGPDILLKAFCQEFSRKDDVCLFIHSLSMLQNLSQKKVSLNDWLDSFAPSQNRAPIFVTGNYIYDAFLPAIINNFDIFVLPTRAEGFGLPILEAGACKIPSIVTGYSGVLEFADPSNSWLIDYELKDIPLQYLTYFKNYIGGKWAEPSVEHLRSLMRYSYEHRDKVKQKGENAYKKAQLFSVENNGKRAKEIIFER